MSSSFEKNLKKIEKEHNLTRLAADNYDSELSLWADTERHLKLTQLLQFSAERKFMLGLIRKYAGIHILTLTVVCTFKKMADNGLWGLYPSTIGLVDPKKFPTGFRPRYCFTEQAEAYSWRT